MSARFEAVILRFVPDIGSGETLNVGVAMRTVDGAFFDVRWTGGLGRVTGAFPEAHAPSIRFALNHIGSAIRKVFGDGRVSFPALDQTLDRELRHIIPDADGTIQWSEAISGATDNPRATFDGLYERFVERDAVDGATKVSRADADVEDRLVAVLQSMGLDERLETRELRSPNHRTFTREFRYCWKNGVWNCLEPLSLDLVEPRTIHEKASACIGNVLVLDPTVQNSSVIFYVGLPHASRAEAFEAASDALAAIGEQAKGALVYREDQAEELALRVQSDLRLYS